MAFAHLHVHSEFSLLDGACRIKPLLAAAKERGFSELAITDHGVMYGVVEFYKQARSQGIHPVIGCEMYTTQSSMRERNPAMREYNHLILLCQNQKGYQNLTKLSSLGFTQGFYYKPRVDFQALEEYGEGLIALSACLSGVIPRLILEGRAEDARLEALRYRDLFGEGNYYLELQDHGMAEQRLVNQGLIEISRATGIPLVVTNDVHYIDQQDVDAQEVLMCIATGKTLADEQRMKQHTDQAYLKTEAEMAQLFRHVPEALTNAAEIAKRCEVEFDLKTYHLPSYTPPAGKSPDSYLREICLSGMKKRYGDPVPQEAMERYEYEIGMIEQMGYVDYFLIVWDFIKYAKDHDIMVGPGRGSSAGSIVTYALEITGVDPLKYHLIFERFLNPERVTMPDIDIDFCYERRQEVIDYVVAKYGEDRVAQIITFGTMAAKAAIKDVARVLGMPYAEGDRISKLIPFSLNMTLDKALEISQELRTLIDDDENAARLMRLAKAVEGMPRHASTHAAGVVIAARELTDYVPLQANDDVVTTQFPMGTIEELGLLKMDFLGLRTLTVLRDCIDLLQQRGVSLSLEDIPLYDEETYHMLGEGDTDGVFQMESGGMRRVLTELKPDSIDELMATISLYRPGPMESIPRFINGKRQPESVVYEHPVLRNVLGETYGCMVYQEQVMRIVRDMAGYSMGRSDLVRWAMSKKKRDVMEREREVFLYGLTDAQGNIEVPGAIRNGVPEAVATDIFDRMQSFAEYAFPKPHAAAYAMVANQTAYLKCHYPVEFMAASMNSIMGNADKVSAFIQYCRHNGITILPPDVNRSGDRFTVEDGAIRFGLTGVRNVGANAVKAMLRARQERPFDDLFDFLERIDSDVINKRAVESLIFAGALDSLPGTRAQKGAVYASVMDGAATLRKKNIEGQVSLFTLGGQGAEPSRPTLPNVEDYAISIRLQREKEMTGVYISGHPLQEYSEKLDSLPMNAQMLAAMMEEEQAVSRRDGQYVQMGGMIAERRLKTTRNNQMMSFVQLEDLYGTVECLVFPRTHEKYAELLREGAVVLLYGKLSLQEEDTPKLLVDRVEPLTKESRPAKAATNARLSQTLCLRVEDMNIANAIKPLLSAYPGETPVLLRLTRDGTAVRAPRDWFVQATDALIMRLQNQLGVENVALVERGEKRRERAGGA